MHLLKAIAAAAAAVSVLTAASCGVNEQKQTPLTPTELIWYLPSNNVGNTPSSVSEDINAIIHETYPNINLEIKYINIYEYSTKMSVYIASGDQADAVWVNDDIFQFAEYVRKNIYKALDAPIKAYAPTILQRMAQDPYETYSIYDKEFFFPTLLHNDGLIPFIKIPKELTSCMDLNRLKEKLEKIDTADDELFSILTEYLDRLKEKNLIGSGVNFTAVSKLFPLIGYETYVSTDDLIGYKIDDPSRTPTDMLSTSSTAAAYNTYRQWYDKSYIREDIAITYKQPQNSRYSYVLDGAWGYIKDGKCYLVNDTGSGDYVYIAVDNKYHRQKQFTYSAVIIPAASSHFKETTQVMELFYKDHRLYDLASFGKEGQDYIKKNGCAVRTDSRYLSYEGILPAADGALTTVPMSNVYLPQMHSGKNTPDMYIPPASSDRNHILNSYIEEYGMKNYELDLKSNSGSDIAAVLELYNAH
ncbi:MAG: hypothetical protein SOS24_09740 [Clostridia bacterium]|nr:hypothetical protein [Clostridia bacterium]